MCHITVIRVCNVCNREPTHPTPGWLWAGKTQTPERCSVHCWCWSRGLSGETASCLTAVGGTEYRNDSNCSSCAFFFSPHRQLVSSVCQRLVSFHLLKSGKTHRGRGPHLQSTVLSYKQKKTSLYERGEKNKVKILSQMYKSMHFQLQRIHRQVLLCLFVHNVKQAQIAITTHTHTQTIIHLLQ